MKKDSPQQPQSWEGENILKEGMAKMEGTLGDWFIQLSPKSFTPIWEECGVKTQPSVP